MAETTINERPILKKGEAGNLQIPIPETQGVKTVTIDLPEGIETSTQEEIVLAPTMKLLDLPIFVSKQAPDKFEITLRIAEQPLARNERATDTLLKTTMKINVELEK